eukprot:TRINITY_DN9828_c0_g1_i1.p1 TRINITY_DN9828_c0_g1~~TRINITY_DN9828_c0_g1_i1.p1  ORF type:complete len:302 (+),score=31.90 TRINITY_DN9828_c0_g1_i1:35-940(+)
MYVANSGFYFAEVHNPFITKTPLFTLCSNGSPINYLYTPIEQLVKTVSQKSITIPLNDIFITFVCNLRLIAGYFNATILGMNDEDTINIRAPDKLVQIASLTDTIIFSSIYVGLLAQDSGTYYMFLYTDNKNNVDVPDRLESNKVVIILKGNLQNVKQGDVATQFGKHFGFRVGYISKNKKGNVMRVPVPKESVSIVLAQKGFTVNGEYIKIERYQNKYRNISFVSGSKIDDYVPEKNKVPNIIQRTSTGGIDMENPNSLPEEQSTKNKDNSSGKGRGNVNMRGHSSNRKANKNKRYVKKI